MGDVALRRKLLVAELAIMFVYRATNTVNGKIYIGACRRATLDNRKAQHKSRALGSGQRALTPFHKAIRKYGWDAFTWDIVEHCDSPAALEIAERRWIASRNSMSRHHGYNRSAGGGGTLGCEASAETRAKMSASLRLRHALNPPSAETRAKRSATLKGRKPSAACYAALKGRIVSKEGREKLRLAIAGKAFVLSDAARANRAAAAKRRSENGVGAKLHPSLYPEIRNRRLAGESFEKIGRIYGVSPSGVFYFCKRMRAPEVSLAA